MVKSLIQAFVFRKFNLCYYATAAGAGIIPTGSARTAGARGASRAASQARARRLTAWHPPGGAVQVEVS
jgi:hypothetical protein